MGFTVVKTRIWEFGMVVVNRFRRYGTPLPSRLTNMRFWRGAPGWLVDGASFQPRDEAEKALAASSVMLAVDALTRSVLQPGMSPSTPSTMMSAPLVL